MGKQGKKQNNHQRRGKASSYYLQEEEQGYPVIPQASSPPTLSPSSDENTSAEEEENDQIDQNPSTGDPPSKFSLYQQSVQSPKGDISYLQKFFSTYVGGRVPLHLQEDFCGTALLSTEWLRTDSRRTAVGLYLDLEALNWCMENNVNKVGADLSSRISLFHGNVLQPLEARVVKSDLEDRLHNVALEENEGGSQEVAVDSTIQGKPNARDKLMKDFSLPARDIVCAFNYSCCCLHTRHELVSYFKHALGTLSRKGGIFVMDLYGGTSSECELRMQGSFQISHILGSKLDLTLFEGKQELACTLLSKGNRRNSATRFHTAGDCGHCLR